MPLFDRLEPADYALPASLTDRLLSPALVVHLGCLRGNLRAVIERVGDADRWRPHVKTAKIPAVLAELARVGVRSFKCATTREALELGRVLEAEGVEGDVLLAYPLVGPSLERLGQVAEACPTVRYSLLCEDADLVPAIPQNVEIFVDVNPGMNRTGVPLADARRLLAIVGAAGRRFRGVHYYDGHLHEPDLEARRARIFAGYDELLRFLGELRELGFEVGEVVTAGTPAFLSALDYRPFAELDGTPHRVSPGTVVYHDARSERENPDLALTPAALVFARVVSHPTPDTITCDAGSKSIAAEAGDPCAHVLGRPELVAQTPNEEHLPLRVTTGPLPERGTMLQLIPHHVCPTINLAEQAVLIEDGKVRDVVAVAARAHETLLEPE